MRYALMLLLVVSLTVLTASILFATSSEPPPANRRLTFNSQLQNEEQIFLCPTDSNIVIANWRDFRLGYRQVGVGRSEDGGQTWTDSLIHPTMQYFFFDSKQSDPTLSVDRDGNFYMNILDYDAFGQTGGSVLSFYRSTDKGLSWTGPVANIHSIQNNIFEDKQFMTVDRTGGPYNGNIYLSWTRFGALGSPNQNPDRIMFVRSTDGAQSVDDTVTIGPIQTPSNCSTDRDAGQFSIPIVSSNGDVHVFWMGTAYDSAYCGGPTVIKHVVSNDGGQNFTYEDTILTVSGYTLANGGVHTYSMPVGDADIFGGPFDGNIYLAFTNRGTGDTRTDVDFIKSSDNGLTWSSPIKINDAENSQNMDAFHPWLVCNEEGILAIIFYDQRFNGPSYFDFDLMAAYSFDGGETFTANHRISSASSSPFDLSSVESNPHDNTITDDLNNPTVDKVMAGLIGEYIGITAYHDKMVAVWTDSRDGNSEVYNASWYLPMLEPRLSAPENDIETLFPPVFRWATSWKNNEDKYRLEISTSPDFSTDLITGTSDTNYYSLEVIPPFGALYWRVKTFNATETDSSDYSEVRSFTLTQPVSCCLGIRGNVDNDPLDEIDIADIVYYVEYSFDLPPGPAPPCFDEADVNADNSLDIADIVYMVEYSFDLPPGPQPLDCPKSFLYRYTSFDNLSNPLTEGWFQFVKDNSGNLIGNFQLENISGQDNIPHVSGYGYMGGYVGELSPVENYYYLNLNLTTIPPTTDFWNLDGYYQEGNFYGTWTNVLTGEFGTFSAFIPAK